MEQTQPASQMADALGITSTTLTNTPLDEGYLDSLFGASPDDVEQISNPGKPDQPDGQPEAAPDKTQQQPPLQPGSFVVDEPDFIAGLNQGETKPLTTSNKPTEKPQQPEDSSGQAPTSPGETENPTTDNSPVLKDHLAHFVTDLFTVGILTTDQGEKPEDIQITTPESLIDRLTHEKKKGAVQILENILSQFGPEYRQAFNAIYIDGVHPREYFSQVENVESLEGLDLSRPENQKYVLARYYKTLGWDTAKINAKIEKLENYQDLEEEARDIHTTLLAQEKQVLNDTQERKKEELARKAQQDQEYQTGVHRILKEKLKAGEIDGIPLDEKTATELSTYMLAKKWQLADQQISDFEKEVLDLTRPEHRETQIKVALFMHLLKTDPTLSRLQRKAITAQTNTMFSFLQRQQSTAKKQGKKVSHFFDD